MGADISSLAGSLGAVRNCLVRADVPLMGEVG